MKIVFVLIWVLFSEQTLPAGGTSGGGGGNDSLTTILLVAGALGLREVIGLLISSLVNKKKTNAETDAINRKTELDEKQADAAEFDKAIRRFNEATEKAVEFSNRVFEVQTECSRLTAENLIYQKKEKFWDDERTHLEKALKLGSEEVNQKNKAITDLRGELQDCDEELKKWKPTTKDTEKNGES